jgi:adenylate kinase
VKLVSYISVPENVLIDRLTGRWTCRKAGHVFHEKYSPPQTKGVCDFDGSELYQREDDKPETVKVRIHVYLEQTLPLIEYYQKLGVLSEVDGTKSIEQVTSNLLAAIQRNGKE